MVNGASHSAMIDPHQINILNIYIASVLNATKTFALVILSLASIYLQLIFVAKSDVVQRILLLLELTLPIV